MANLTQPYSNIARLCWEPGRVAPLPVSRIKGSAQTRSVAKEATVRMVLGGRLARSR
jgi:hypothetical protein